MEITIKKEALNIAARFLEKMLNTDTSDYAGSAVTCISCGKKARYVSHYSKTFTLILGNISLNRAYYYCQTCGHGWCPKDYALGFGDSSLSPGVTRMVSLVASAESFLEGSKLLFELAAINVSGKCVERTAKKMVPPLPPTKLSMSKKNPTPVIPCTSGLTEQVFPCVQAN